MADQRLQPWLLLNNNQKIPGNIPARMDISLNNPNQGLSLADANSIVEQQKQAINFGFLPPDNMPSFEYTSARSPEDDAMIKEIADSYAKEKQLQQETLKQAEAQLAAARSKPQQMDLSPLIALAEGWSQEPIGLLRAYQKPQDQAKTVQALQEAVLKSRGGAIETERMRAKDIGQLNLQERQLKTNEELKRLTIESMKKGKDEKGDTKALDREIALVGKITGSKEAEAIRGATQMNNAINNYVNTINKYKGNILDAKARADIGNAYESTIMAFKAAEELGALQKEDVVRAEQKLPNVASYSTALARMGGVAPDIDTAIKIIKQIPQEYGGRGRLALERLKSGYGKYGGQEIINQFESDLNSSMSSGNSRQQMLQMEAMKRAKARGGSQ